MDANDIVDKHDHPRAMYKWRNKENQKRMIDPIVSASHGSYRPWDVRNMLMDMGQELF